MLIEPVAQVRPGDPGPPPRLGRVLAAPRRGGVPVVVEVVIVEDHCRRDDGKQPAHGRLAPRLAVQAAVLGEVGDLVSGRLGLVAALPDELPRRRAGIVGVHLIADHQQRVGPAVARRLAQPRREGGQGVRPVRHPRDPRPGDPAGAERQPYRAAPAVTPAVTPAVAKDVTRGADRARRKRRTWLRPADGAVQRDLVLVLRSWAQVVGHHERVIVPGHLECARPVTEGRDLAGPVGLHPDRGGGLADVPQQRTEDELRGARVRGARLGAYACSVSLSSVSRNS